MEQIIRDYFISWINKDISIMEQYFADDIVYIECYGPCYNDKSQCLKWFTDWNKKGSVLVWDIEQIITEGNTLVIEWYFECDYEGDIGGFNGVSIIEFNEDILIVSVKEFQSKAEHDYPYGE